VRDFVELAFSYAGLDYRKHVKTDPELYRPAEVNLLRGDASKACRLLGWSPRIGFEELVREMVEADCRAMAVKPSDVVLPRPAI
jgi:GDPmannose 4,6-dehydratase